MSTPHCPHLHAPRQVSVHVRQLALFGPQLSLHVGQLRQKSGVGGVGWMFISPLI